MPNEIEVYTVKRIQNHPNWFYTVEDFNRDVGDYGITLSYVEQERGEDNRLRQHIDRSITISDPDVAIEIAQAMLTLAENLKR